MTLLQHVVSVIQEPAGRDDLLGLVSASQTARGQRGEALPMRARHWPSECVRNSKNAPQPQAATEGLTRALDIEVIKPAWPRCSARKRLRRFSPVHTITSTLGATVKRVNEATGLVPTCYSVLPQK